MLLVVQPVGDASQVHNRDLLRDEEQEREGEGVGEHMVGDVLRWDMLLVQWFYNGWLWYEEERGGWTSCNISK